jgi:hypothetical protein
MKKKLSLLSCSTRIPHLSVVSFSGRRTYSAFPTVLYFCFVSTIHNFRAVCTYFLALSNHPTQPKAKEGKGREARKENSQAGKKEKVFQLSTLFRSYFCVFFVFPFIPFQSFANISLTWNNLNICCSSRHIIHSLSFTRSFSFPPRIFQ